MSPATKETPLLHRRLRLRSCPGQEGTELCPHHPADVRAQHPPTLTRCWSPLPRVCQVSSTHSPVQGKSRKQLSPPPRPWGAPPREVLSMGNRAVEPGSLPGDRWGLTDS